MTLLKTPFIPDKLYQQAFQVFLISRMHLVEEAYYRSPQSPQIEAEKEVHN